MTTHLSDQANDLITRSSLLVQAYHAHKDAILSSLLAIFQQIPADTTLDILAPDSPSAATLGPPATVEKSALEAFFYTLLLLLSSRADRLRQTDELVFRETSEDAAASQDVEESFKACRDSFIRFRARLEGFFGPSFLQRINLHGPTPRDPAGLSQVIRALATLFGEPTFVLPKPLDQGVTPPSKDDLLTSLSALLSPLEIAFQAWQRETKETQAARLQRQDALDSAHTAFSSLASCLEAFARLAGLSDIAQRIRPSQRSAPTSSTNS